MRKKLLKIWARIRRTFKKTLEIGILILTIILVATILLFTRRRNPRG